MEEWIKKNVQVEGGIIFSRILIWLSGLSVSIAVVESTYLMHGSYPISFRSWPRLWLGICIFGFFLGILMYFIRGWIYWFAVMIAGGKTTFKRARRIFIYSGMPIYLTTIFIEIMNMTLYWNYYFEMKTPYILDISWIALKLTAFTIFLLTLFRISRNELNTKRIRSIIIFILIPILYNALSLSSHIDEIMNIYKVIPYYF